MSSICIEDYSNITTVDHLKNVIFSTRFNKESYFEHVGDLFLEPIRQIFGRTDFVLTDLDGRVQSIIVPPLPVKENSILYVGIIKIISIIGLIFTPIGCALKLCGLYTSTRARQAYSILPVLPTHAKEASIYQHIYRTREFLYRPNNFLCGAQIVMKDDAYNLRLHECACGNTGAFDRINQPRRVNLERSFFDSITHTQPNKSERIAILSLGAAGMLGEFLLVEKLILAGYKDIFLVCVDPIFKDDAIKQFNAVRQFFSSYPNVRVNMQVANDVNEVSDDMRFHGVTAIDFDALTGFSKLEASKALVDFGHTMTLLDPNGFAALGFSRDDFLLSRSSAPIALQSACIIPLSADMQKHLPLCDDLYVALPSYDRGLNVIFLLALAIGLQQKDQHPDSIQISFLGEGRGLNVTNEAEITRNYMKFLQKILPNIRIVLCKDNKRPYDLFCTGYAEKCSTPPLHNQSVVYNMHKNNLERIFNDTSIILF